MIRRTGRAIARGLPVGGRHGASDTPEKARSTPDGCRAVLRPQGMDGRRPCRRNRARVSQAAQRRAERQYHSQESVSHVWEANRRSEGGGLRARAPPGPGGGGQNPRLLRLQTSARHRAPGAERSYLLARAVAGGPESPSRRLRHSHNAASARERKGSSGGTRWTYDCMAPTAPWSSPSSSRAMARP